MQQYSLANSAFLSSGYNERRFSLSKGLLRIEVARYTVHPICAVRLEKEAQGRERSDQPTGRMGRGRSARLAITRTAVTASKTESRRGVAGGVQSVWKGSIDSFGSRKMPFRYAELARMRCWWCRPIQNLFRFWPKLKPSSSTNLARFTCSIDALLHQLGTTGHRGLRHGAYCNDYGWKKKRDISVLICASYLHYHAASSMASFRWNSKCKVSNLRNSPRKTPPYAQLSDKHFPCFWSLFYRNSSLVSPWDRLANVSVHEPSTPRCK